MAYSPIEQRYIDMVVEGYFPTMPTEPAPAAEEASLEGVQLAAGQSKTRTDAPAGAGLPKAPTTPDEAAELMRRMPLATQSEMIMRRIAEDQKAGVVGAVIPKDMTMRENMVSGMQQMLIDNTGMDNARARRLAQTMFGGESSNLPLGIGLIDLTPFVIPLAAQEAGISAGEAREAALGGEYGTAALKYGTGVLQGLGVVPGVAMAKTGVKAAGEALAPVAGEMIEGYMRKTGGLMDAVPPQDYMGAHRAPSREFGASLDDLTGGGQIYPADVYSKQGPRIYGTRMPYDKKAFDIAYKAKGNPDAEVTIYRAVPSEVTSTEINRGDWVAITKEYAKHHGDSVLRGDYKIITKKVKARDIYTNGDSIQEWGYDPAVKENK